jgi:hypothetical protein
MNYNDFPGGRVALGLFGADGEFLDTLASDTVTSLYHYFGRSFDFNAAIPDTIEPGDYVLRVLAREAGGDWVRASGNGLWLDSLNLKVNEAVRYFDVRMSELASSTAEVDRGEAFLVSARLENFAPQTFAGAVGAFLVKAGDTATIIDTLASPTQTLAYYSRAVEWIAAVPLSVEPGSYQIRIFAKDALGHDWEPVRPLADTCVLHQDLIVKEGIQIHNLYVLSDMELRLNYVSRMAGLDVSLEVYLINAGATFNGKFGLSFINAAGDSVAMMVLPSEVTVGKSLMQDYVIPYQRTLTGFRIPDTLTPGDYTLRLYASLDGDFWAPIDGDNGEAIYATLTVNRNPNVTAVSNAPQPVLSGAKTQIFSIQGDYVGEHLEEVSRPGVYILRTGSASKRVVVR